MEYRSTWLYYPWMRLLEAIIISDGWWAHLWASLTLGSLLSIKSCLHFIDSQSGLQTIRRVVTGTGTAWTSWGSIHSLNMIILATMGLWSSMKYFLDLERWLGSFSYLVAFPSSMLYSFESALNVQYWLSSLCLLFKTELLGGELDPCISD